MQGLKNRQGKRRQPKSRSRDDDRKVPSVVEVELQEDDQDWSPLKMGRAHSK